VLRFRLPDTRPDRRPAHTDKHRKAATSIDRATDSSLRSTGRSRRKASLLSKFRSCRTRIAADRTSGDAGIKQELKTMLKNNKALIAALTATALIAAGVARAENQSTSNQQKLTPQQIAADKDFGKVSADGVKGLQDLSLTRLAIFDGRVDDAKKFIAEAVTAFNKAKADETVFNKAESALKAPAAKDAAENKTAALAKPSDASKTAQVEKVIAWLPVDGSIVIDEDYKAKTAKTAAVADANKSLKGGDRKAALEKLKLADVNVVVIVAVLPLEETIAKVDQAAKLINEGKYYEASQDLRQVQDSERFDVADDNEQASK